MPVRVDVKRKGQHGSVPAAVLSVFMGLFAEGCSALPPAQMGQVAGTLIGAAVAPGLGGAVGGMIGTLAGLVVQGEMDHQTENKERTVLGEQLEENPSPKTQGAAAQETPQQTLEGVPVRVWVDETTQGGRTVAGHFEERVVN